jgi:hypothetical protein
VAGPASDRSLLLDDYSGLLGPAKWRIVGARADAWLMALVDAISRSSNGTSRYRRRRADSS